MRKFFLILTGFLTVNYAFTQDTGKITGGIITEKPEVSQSFVTLKLHTATDSTFIKGNLSDIDGNFIFENIQYGNYYLEVSFFGFENKYVNFSLNENQLDLGKIKIAENEKVLDQVMVISKQDVVKYEIDKKVLKVSQDYANTSATAFEVLENVPSISTDIEGNLSLRGSSSYTLLIDGKPSLMDASDALKMIPASSIEDIEIMTNPSSKFDSEGVSGVINIITKKDKTNGTSGIINIGAGLYNAYNADGTFQIQRKKVTLNLGANFRTNDSPSQQITERLTKSDSLDNLYRLEGENLRKRLSFGATAGIEFRLNEKNAINVSYEYSGFKMSMDNKSTIQTFTNGEETSSYYNTENRDWDFSGSRAYLDYFHYFNDKKSHFITLSGFYRGRNGEEEAITNYYYTPGSLDGGNRNTETGPTGRFRFKLDYQKPFENGNQFLAGLQSDLGNSTDFTKAFTYDPTAAEYIETPLFSTDVNYTRNIHAAYLMFNGKVKKLGYQFGLRGEYTDRDIIPSKGESAKIERFDLFPSVHTSYQQSDKTQFILSYSRKIERPRSWYMEPFITWVDQYSVRTGNINLLPEYINSFEFGWIQNMSKKSTFSFEAYHRQVINKTERIQRVYEDEIVITMPENVGTSNATGLELSLDHIIKPWWRATVSGTVFNYMLKGQVDDLIFDQQAINWTAQLNNSFSLKNDWKIQLMTSYNGPVTTAQGLTSPFFRANLALRKSFWKKNATATLQVRDVFSTTKRESTTISNNIEIYSLNEPRTPTIVVGLSLKFNNFKEKRNANNDNGDDF
ncbi:outer membrane beta-barrel protein [Crocinitomix catalasitica]|uniref:outer membrane beta-barrel protein n=1 Tax=Crocinitomix catalasitica TaxID=184607 RepID=UPI000488417D|nr:outer membrane beta-barrel protein [Crocinitomix catalasitica]